MKKFIIAIIFFPMLLTFGYGFGNSKFQKKQNFSELENASIIDLEFSEDGNTNGVVIDTDGDQYGDTIYMWGQNNNYQIGDGTATSKFSPIKITPQGQDDWGGNIINLEIAQLFSGVTIDTDLDGYADTLYMWGSNYRGEIGNGEVTGFVATPEVITPQGQNDWDGNIINISLMYGNTAILIDTNNDGYGDLIYGWGENTDYEISPKEDPTILYPEIITPESGDWGGNIIDLKLGARFGGVTIDTDSDGFGDTLYMWGDNTYGELGQEKSYEYIQYPTIITPNSGDWGGNIINLAIGFYNTGVLIDTDSDGIGDLIYGWGQNNYGQIGDGTEINKYDPVIVTPESGDWNGNILQFEKGSYTTGVIVDSDLDGLGDLLYLWGDNSSGQIGIGTTNNVSSPTLIYPKDQSSWPGSIYSVSNGFSSTGLIVDNNNDGLFDSFYACGNDDYGQIGNGSNDGNSNQLYFIAIYSNESFSIDSLDFIFDDNELYIDLKLNDYNNEINKDPTVILIDSEDNIYTTTFISSNSDIPNDQYYYLVNGIERGTNYYFKEIVINDVSTPLDEEQFTTDYIISDYSISSVTEETATIDLNLNQNNNVNFSDYTNDQLKIKVNYTDLDRNNSYSKETTINTLKEIELTDLYVETNYQIDSIQYFYENGNYKYNIEKESVKFETKTVDAIVQTNTIEILEESITTTSFKFTVEIDNLIPNLDNTNFTNYDVNNGIWLKDTDGNIYEATFIDEEFYQDSDYNGAYDYIMTYELNGLNDGEEYQFNGISLDQPTSPDDSSIIPINPSIDVLIPDDGLIDAIILGYTFTILDDTITDTSFEYTIEVDNLLLENVQLQNVKANPTFSNFDPYSDLYLKDINNDTYSSSYVNNSGQYISAGTEDTTVIYRFTFEVDGLQPDTDYQFIYIGLSQNGPFEDVNDGIIHTNSNDDDCCFPFWWWVTLIILLIIIVILLICLLFKGNSHKEKIKRKEKIKEDKKIQQEPINNIEQSKPKAKRKTTRKRKPNNNKSDETKKLTEEISELSQIVKKIDEENKDIKINIQGINQESTPQQKRKKASKKVDKTEKLTEEITELSKIVQQLNNSNNNRTKKTSKRSNKNDKLTEEISELSQIVREINKENKDIKNDLKEINKENKDIKSNFAQLNNSDNAKNNPKPIVKVRTVRRSPSKTDKLSEEITELSRIVKKIDEENKDIKKDIKEISKKKK